ncbi:serine/threonine-protein kinase [Streptomyces tagetis]|uniref:non-specific serine/threonine protein kinase n=1 Tax=Streptomyces tagetis TaxID=2820809 RepID=A0A940XE46_9ACTN|nr:serine/threonine-protein kinase [Streptomyces sp. RG38]MBQ0828633.1 serine/threonine protein kinase [Streptomyces sp. RG38]
MQGRLVAGRYRLGEAIGSGGMGRVWRAHDEVLHRAVAIKELTAAHYVSESDQAILLARTRGEARAAARINHSAVVTVHDVLEHDGRPWIVMELVEGRSLADAVRDEERVAPREAARIGLWVLRALRAAHAAGVLHRDVKPGNVLLAADGRVLLTDFGIAQIEGDSTITRTGEVVGSVDYLAPERIRGQDPGPSSDLWALGATLYTAVEGRSPFRRTSPLTTMQAVVEEEAAEPRDAGPLAPVIAALLRKDPATRPDATETERLLAQAAEGRIPEAGRPFDPAAPTVPYGAGAPGAHGAPAHGTHGTHGSPAHTAHTAPAHGTHGPHGTHAAHAAPPHAPEGVPATVPTAGTGPATPTPTAPAPAAPAVPTRSLRRRLRTLVLVVAVAALVGGGTAVVLQKQTGGDSGTGQGAPREPSPSATGTPSAADPGAADPAAAGPAGILPDGWERREDPVGFSLSLPKGWERRVFGDDGELVMIDYTPDDGEHFLRVAVDTEPDFNDPYAHQLDLEQQLQRLVDYERVTLRRTTYRDRDSARWEYTWTALAKDTAFPGPRRAVEETYMSRDGVEYALYMSGPAEGWETTRRQFTTVLQSWQEKTG